MNKDFARDVMVQTALPKGYSSAVAFRLIAPSLDSKDHVTLAGAEVSANGRWIAGLPEKVAVEEGIARLPVPHASAILVKLRHD